MKLLTLARDLTRRKARERQGLFVAEGIRCVDELAASAVVLQGALIGPQLVESSRGQDLAQRLRARTTVEEVTAAEFASAAATDSPQGVLAIGAIPDRALGQLGTSAAIRLLVLDGIQDPGNVGTMLRTAAALGATAAVALPGTVDLWNAKVVRSAMGALFSFPAFDTTWDALDAFRVDRGLVLWGADTRGDAVASLDPPTAIGIVVGNEGAGLSPEARSRVDRVVAIPMASGVESLNVAVAAGVLLYDVGLRRAAVPR